MTPPETASALAILTALLRGEGDPGRIADEDWSSVIGAAGEAWLVPLLARATEGRDLPPDVRAYLDFIRERNRTRNGRLRAELSELLHLLAGEGVEAMPVKGAVHLLLAEESRLPDRMMGDLDLVVPAGRRADVCRILLAAGRRLWRAPGEESEVFFRPEDVAPVEIHSPTPGHPAYAALDRLERPPQRIAWGGLSVPIPDASTRLLHLVLHDRLRDGALWRGGCDLRHLVDARLLIRSGEVDHAAIRAALRTRIERAAAASFLELAEAMSGGPVPPIVDRAALDRARRLRLARDAAGPAGAAFRAAGKAAWFLVRLTRGDADLRDLPGPFRRRSDPSADHDEPVLPLGSGPRIEPGPGRAARRA